MSIDHIVMIVVGLAGACLGLYAIAEAKAYKVRRHQNGGRHEP